MPDIVLELKDASVYQRKNMIVTDVNLKIKKGEFVYLIGKTGSGKSSFIKTLYADIPLMRGYGYIVGFDLHTIKAKQIPFLRRKLGIVFQDFKLLPDRSVYKNLSFVLKVIGWKNKIEIDDKVQEVLSKIKMQGQEEKLPHLLSGGEQQRVAIARALLNDPELILADEPTGNLDPVTSLEIMKVFLEINKSGKTILFATHNYNLISKFPSKTLRCEGSEIFEVVQKNKNNG